MLGESLGLVVIGGDSCTKGCEFESQQCTLDGHFSHTYLLKNLQWVFEKTKINEKEAGVGPFLKRVSSTMHDYTLELGQFI